MTTSKRGAKRGAQGYGRLDRQVILDASLRLTARAGVTDVRFRDLGVELKADPTAVYRHFRNKQALITALIERLLEEVAGSLQEVDDSAAFLLAGADSLFDTFLRHPAIGTHLADARPVGPTELALAERILRSLEAMGLRGDTLVAHYATFSGFVLAYIANACRVQEAGDGLDLDDVPWIPEDVQFTAATHPALSRHGEALGMLDFHSTYRSAVRVIVDSMTRAAEG